MQTRLAAIFRCVFITLLAAILLGTQVSFADSRVSGKTFSLVATNVHFYDAVRFENAPIKEQFEAVLIAGLESKGLKYVGSDALADLELSYIAVLENAATDAEIATFRAAHPHIASLPNNPQQFEGGMVFAKLTYRDSRVKVWDNTYRGLVALDMPVELRKARMQAMIESLLSTLGP